MKLEDIEHILAGDGTSPVCMRGTSYEMVVSLFENGVLKGNQKLAEKRGGLYIYAWPVRENWNPNGLVPPVPWSRDYWNPMDWSERFAKIHAEEDFFASRVGFTMVEYRRAKCGGDGLEKIERAKIQRNLTDEDIENLAQETGRRGGYILDFNPDLIRRHLIERDKYFCEAEGCVAIQINCPNGIDWGLISRIRPIGKRDEELISLYLQKR
ncbi:MAG: hypothetical protein AABX59_00845 [Nanoarchaeota archaeon]